MKSLIIQYPSLICDVLGDDPSTTSTADITITIRDVNDEVPTFNKQEYKVSIQVSVKHA